MYHIKINTVKSLIETAVSIDYFEIEIHSHASI